MTTVSLRPLEPGGKAPRVAVRLRCGFCQSTASGMREAELSHTDDCPMPFPDVELVMPPTYGGNAPTSVSIGDAAAREEWMSWPIVGAIE